MVGDDIEESEGMQPGGDEDAHGCPPTVLLAWYDECGGADDILMCRVHSLFAIQNPGTPDYDRSDYTIRKV